MTDRELMQKIHTEWGTLIAEACKPIPPEGAYVMAKPPGVQPAFLAALIANESGGEPNAKRFEKNVLADIFEVLLGRETFYAGINRPTFMEYIDAGAVSGQASGWLKLYLTNTFNKLDGLATSWGLTQIMGWHILQPSWVNAPGWFHTVDDLRVPKNNLLCTRALLEEFAVRFQLDLQKEFAALFCCWNTGRPNGRTTDPVYVTKGFERIKLYEEIAAESAASAQKPDKTQ